MNHEEDDEDSVALAQTYSSAEKPKSFTFDTINGTTGRQGVIMDPSELLRRLNAREVMSQRKPSISIENTCMHPDARRQNKGGGNKKKKKKCKMSFYHFSSQVD